MIQHQISDDGALSRLDRPICLIWPEHLAKSAWLEHLPFAFWIVDATRPRMIVELGTHYGTSYCGFLQAVQHLQLATRCYAVDTWKGNPQTESYGEDVYDQLRAYHDRRYAAFSTLIRSTFDEAVQHFANASIDLLHIDGYHTYDAVRHDFETWLPKLSRHGIVLFHDINVRERDFGIWRLWGELATQYPSFEFLHGFGLGILGVGEDLPADIRWLTGTASGQENLTLFTRTLFENLGRRIREHLGVAAIQHKLAASKGSVARLTSAIAERDEKIARISAELSAREGELVSLAATLAARDGEIDLLNNQLDALHNSTCWRITAPLRSLVRGARLGIGLTRQLSGRAPLHDRNVPPAPITDDYAEWIGLYDTINDDDRRAIAADIARMSDAPLISVIMPVYETLEPFLRAAIESVCAQLYPHWELCIADDASTKPHVQRVLKEFVALDSRIRCATRDANGHISAATNSALDLATGVFVVLLDHDDLLAETALYEIALELAAHPDADVIYSDSDCIDDSGRRSAPYFKTDWDLDLMRGHNMVTHLGAYRRSLVEKVGRMRVGFEGSQDYDLTLRIVDASAPERIRHIPAVLYHWRRHAVSASFSETARDRCVVAARRAIREHLERNGVRARIDVAPKFPSWTRIVYPLPGKRPLVSIIVPTRDKWDLLAGCADGVLTRTDYSPLELVIVDNDSKEAKTQRLLELLAQDNRVKIVRHPGVFNYAAINNRGVQEANGDIIVLMNNDVDVISPVWLEEMASQALRPEVGAVGAKLLYADGRMQHAGVVLGVGHGAGHFFHAAARDTVDAWGFLWMVRRVSAVTGACMALRRSVYLEVGGLDEFNFPIGFNDVDFCLRLGERGYAIVWTPHAELYHLESATRGADTTQLERDAEQLRRRWGKHLNDDPFYNPNCSLTMAEFGLGFPPRRRKPWLATAVSRDTCGACR